MNRKEFLEILRSQLAGQMQEGKAAAHIRYYEDYIQSQVRARQEQEKIRRRREQNYRKTQQNLEAGRRTIQGQRR